MGIIASVMPEVTSTDPVKRTQVTSKNISSIGRINIYKFVHDKNLMKCLLYEHLDVSDNNSNLDVLWKPSRALKIPTPMWSGFMQLACKGSHPGKSSVVFMPMIDLDPMTFRAFNSTLNLSALMLPGITVFPS